MILSVQLKTLNKYLVELQDMLNNSKKIKRRKKIVELEKELIEA